LEECNNIKYETGSSTAPPRVRDCHLEIAYYVITQPRIARVKQNLATCSRIGRKLMRSGQNRKGKKNYNMADVCFSKPEVGISQPLIKIR